RLHPLLNNECHLGTRWAVVADRPTISIGLQDGVQAAFAGPAGSNHRNMVERAVRLGMRALCQPPTSEAMQRFSEMYSETMARLGLVALHLGGGRTSSPTDSLLRFKERVGQARHQFSTARLVLDRKRYASLIQTSIRRRGDAASAWFLRYRQA